MKRMLYKMPFSLILMTGMFIGMVKGQEVRQKWLSKMKNRYEEQKASSKIIRHNQAEIVLDEIELATYHS